MPGTTLAFWYSSASNHIHILRRTTLLQCCAVQQSHCQEQFTLYCKHMQQEVLFELDRGWQCQQACRRPRRGAGLGIA